MPSSSRTLTSPMPDSSTSASSVFPVDELDFGVTLFFRSVDIHSPSKVGWMTPVVAPGCRLGLSFFRLQNPSRVPLLLKCSSSPFHALPRSLKQSLAQKFGHKISFTPAKTR